MTNREFINTIIDYYVESRELTCNFEKYNIWRGVNHSVSSKAEDLFALFIAKKIDRLDIELIVDKTMSYRTPDGKSKQFRPDLAIVQNGILTHIIDLKMDMGYKRRYHETEKFKSEEVMYSLIRSQTNFPISYNQGPYIEPRFLAVSSNIKCQIVVISERNEGKSSNRTDMTASINCLDWARIYYLTGNIHPNYYGERAKELITIYNETFNTLINDIRANLS